MPFAIRLKHWREDRQLTQSQLAARAEVSVSLISKIERGGYTNVALSTIEKLADALHLKSPLELLEHIPARRR